MKTKLRNHPQTAMTRAGVLAVAIILVTAAGFLLPALNLSHGCKAPASRINCISNLKQIGLAMRMWANDHGDKFPWQVSISETGTLEFVESHAFLYYHFLVVSNELSSPKVLACSDDKKKSRATEWEKFDNRSLSYFIGLDASEANPYSILSGDRNIIGGISINSGIVLFTATNQAGWGTDIHKRQGNIGLGDGSAQQCSEGSLRKQFQAALLSTNVEALRLSIPQKN